MRRRPCLRKAAEFRSVPAARPSLVRGVGRRPAERCRSGRTGRSRKPLYACAYRGFESLPLRQQVRRFQVSRTMRGHTPIVSSTAFGACPLSIRRTSRSRPSGVRRAFLRMPIRFLFGNDASTTSVSQRGGSQVPMIVAAASARNFKTVNHTANIEVLMSSRTRSSFPACGMLLRTSDSGHEGWAERTT